MATTTVFNPHEISLTFLGVLYDGGFADDEYFSAEPLSDLTTSSAGATGDVVVSLTNDARWDVTMRLLQTGYLNQLLTAAYNLKKRGSNTIGMGLFSCRDRITGETLASPEAWVKRAPNVTHGTTVGVREWKIELAHGELGYT